MRAKKQHANNKWEYGKHVVLSGLVIGAFSAAFFAVPNLMPATYAPPLPQDQKENQATNTPPENTSPVNETDSTPVTHVPKPESVRAIYMTACVAGTPSFRSRLVSLVEETEINSIVIDIKDYTGGLSFVTDNPKIAHAVPVGCTATDMQEFINTLHAKDIYVIGRITVFQDPHYTRKYPEQAVHSSSTGEVWKDYKGISYIDPSSRKAWDYTIEIAKESYDIGFDELNFDYIRFPSDGLMSDTVYPLSGARTKASVIESFFAYLSEKLADPARFESGGVPVISADLFGMTTTNTDDLNIGQVLERAAPHFDYIAPMVYPSHYPSGFNGWGNPNKYPYEVVHYSLTRAVTRLLASTTPVKAAGARAVATSTYPWLYAKETYPATMLRPWLQDFDYGGDYDIEEVRTQIQAAYDAGLTSWMLWSPSNQYTREALKPFYKTGSATSTGQQ